MSAFGGKADIRPKPHNVCRAVDDYFCPSAGSGVYMLRPLIIVNSSSDGSADDANSGGEGNTRMRGNHRSS
jgi:hypothetical protein